MKSNRILLVTLVLLMVSCSLSFASQGYNRPSAMPKNSLAFGGKDFSQIKTQGLHSSKILFFICIIESDHLKKTIKTKRLYVPSQVLDFINTYSLI